MRTRIFVLLALALAAAAVPGTGSSRTRDASSAKARSSLRGKVALPGSGRAVVYVLKVKATAKRKRGKVGALRIRTTNKLPGYIRAVAMITPHASKKRAATFTVYIAINDLRGRSSRAAAIPPLDYKFDSSGEGLSGSTLILVIDEKADCPTLQSASTAADAPGATVEFTKLQEKALQPSPDESVFDFSTSSFAAQKKPPCPGVEAPPPNDPPPT